MNRQPAHHVLLGLVVIAAGAAALADNLHWFDISLVQTFWPLALVVGGLGHLLWPRRPGSVFAGIALTGVGLWMQARNLGWFDFAWREAWPVLVMLGGVAIVVRGLQRGRSDG